MSEDKTAEGPIAMSRRRRALGLVAIAGGVFLATLDLSATRLGLVGDVIGPVFPGEDPPAGAWAVIAGYFVAWIVSLPLWGKLSDLCGRRRLWLVGLALFTAASAGSLTSQELIQLTISRFVQGLGVGAIFALGPALIGGLYPPEGRAKWQGVLAGAFGMGLIGWVILTGAVGGVLVNTTLPLDIHHTFVRWSLFLNLPVGIFVVFASWYGLPAARSRIRRRIDTAGAMAFVGTVAPVLLVLHFAGGLFPWLSAPTVALLAGAVVMLAVLVRVEGRADDPMFNLRLLTHRAFLVALVTIFFAGVGLMASSVYAAHFVRPTEGSLFRGLSSNLLGQQAAMVAAFVVGAVVAGQLMARTHRHKALILALLLLATAGTVLLSRMDAFSTQLDIVRNSVISGLGLGGLFTMLVVVVQNAFPRGNLGEATAGSLFCGFLGITIGFGLLARLTAARYRANVEAGGAQPSSDPLLAAEVSLGNLAFGPQAASDLAADVLRASRLDAVSGAFVVVAVLLAVAFVLVALLRSMPVVTETATDWDDASATGPLGLWRPLSTTKEARPSLAEILQAREEEQRRALEASRARAEQRRRAIDAAQGDAPGDERTTGGAQPPAT